jgi:hypothetical protein
MAAGEWMILSFSVFKEKIESGEKCQTIRKFSPTQYKRFLNCWSKRETTGRYNLFWHNPRNGGTRIKDVVPSDRPFLIQFCQYDSYVGKHNQFKRVINTIINAETGEGVPMFRLAIDDGFDNDFDMWDWFYQEYFGRLFDEKFMVLRWHP